MLNVSRVSRMSQMVQEESTMTNQAQVSVQAQGFIPRDYEILAGLDVDKHSIGSDFFQSRNVAAIAASAL